MNQIVARKKAKLRPGVRLRKLKPAVKKPSVSALRNLSADDRELLEKRLTETVECLFDPAFARGSLPEINFDLRAVTHPRSNLILRESGEAEIGPRVAVEVLTAEQERILFTRFNFCRYQSMRILHRYRGQRLTMAAVRELLRWEQLAQATRSDIVRANTSLVLAMARRSRNSGVELTELVSEGNLALLRCVDKFDATRGFKFSTYACRAILASFSRAAAKTARFRSHVPTTYDPAMERSDYLDRKRERIELDCVEELRQILFENSADLSSVERRVLDARFLLSQQQPSLASRRNTLDQVGVLLGVSKERVRQIQNQAMNKLRAVLEQRLLVAS